MSEQTYVMNPKNGRAFINGPNFAKMKGLVPISKDVYEQITGCKVKVKEIVEAINKEAGEKAVAKAIEKSVKVKDAPKPVEAPTVEVKLAGTTVEQIRQDAEAEALADEKAKGNSGMFADLSRENVGVADVIALPDDKLIPFAAQVLKLSLMPSEDPKKARERILTIVGKVEAKRERAKKNV